MKLLLLFLFVFIQVNAFEIRSWNLLRLSENTLEKKNIEFINSYIDEEYDVMCVQEILSKNTLEHLTNNKATYYSNIKSGKKTYKEFLGWFVDRKYKNNEIIDYYDTKDVFERDPSMLYMKDINIGIINFHAIYGREKSKELTGDGEGFTKKEIAKIPDLFQYFHKKTGIPLKRLFVCGDFNLSKGKIEREIGSYYTVGNNEGTTVSSKFGYTNNDYAHIIGFFDMDVKPDYDYLNKWKGSFEDFKKEVSDHIPIKGKL